MQKIELRLPDGGILIIEVSDEQYELVGMYAELRRLTFGGAVSELLRIGFEEIERAGFRPPR